MSNLNNVANRIASHLSVKDEKFGIDPATISIIISIIVNLVKLWWSCRNQSKTKKELKNPSWLFKLMMKREIRKRVKGKRRKHMYDAFMDVAPTLSETELDSILQEIGG
tara:strand:+ start:3925 stop:4251 length:327 start_codon:yes stop_codon:yes gene_type:complete